MRTLIFWSIFVFSCLLSLGARADVIYMTEKPGNVITTDAAASSKVPVWECNKVKRGPKINPVNVPGTTSVYSSNPGTGLDDVAPLFEGGKTAYRCRTKQLDNATGRMKSVSL